MRLAVPVLAILLVALLIGCRSQSPPSPSGGRSPTVVGQTGKLTSEGGAKSRRGGEAPNRRPTPPPPARHTTAEVPPCDPEAFALTGYQVMAHASADLDGDGTPEEIIGCQGVQKDELGEPTEPAYFTLARWTASAWEEWLSIPSPGEERFVEEGSIVSTEDLNEDGVVELVLRFCGFGVSSRPEPVYVWRIVNGAAEEAVDGGGVMATSDDGLIIQDMDLNYPGRELIFAFMEWGEGEAHFEPHRYRIAVYGWAKGLYRKVDSLSPAVKFESPAVALDAYTHGTDY